MNGISINKNIATVGTWNTVNAGNGIKTTFQGAEPINPAKVLTFVHASSEQAKGEAIRRIYLNADDREIAQTITHTDTGKEYVLSYQTATFAIQLLSSNYEQQVFAKVGAGGAVLGFYDTPANFSDINDSSALSSIANSRKIDAAKAFAFQGNEVNGQKTSIAVFLDKNNKISALGNFKLEAGSFDEAFATQLLNKNEFFNTQKPDATWHVLQRFSAEGFDHYLDTTHREFPDYL